MTPLGANRVQTIVSDQAVRSGIGRSIHSAMTVVADGSELAARKIMRVFHSDPALGVARYASAGYPEALDEASRSNVDLASEAS
jgi:urocanate hydratase